MNTFLPTAYSATTCIIVFSGLIGLVSAYYAFMLFKILYNELHDDASNDTTKKKWVFDEGWLGCAFTLLAICCFWYISSEINTIVMNTFSINLQNIINLFTHVKNVHVVVNRNASLILLIILTWMVYAICTEVRIFKAKKSTLWITVLICLVIVIGCVFIFNQSTINWLNQSLSTKIVQVVLTFSWCCMPLSLIADTKNEFIGNWLIFIVAVAIISFGIFIGWLFDPANESANASAILAFAHTIAI